MPPDQHKREASVIAAPCLIEHLLDVLLTQNFFLIVFARNHIATSTWPVLCDVKIHALIHTITLMTVILVLDVPDIFLKRLPQERDAIRFQLTPVHVSNLHTSLLC
jgi:hypothetical protein